MSDGDKGLLILIAIIALFFMGIGLAAATDNQTEWVKTEDSGCYLRVHDDNHLIDDDVTTRTRYCEVP